MNKKILIALVSFAILIITVGLIFNLYKSKNSNPISSYPADSRLVEIFYLPHAPTEAIVKKVESVIAGFPQFQIKEYSFDDPQSNVLVEKYGLKDHMPVAIFVGGKNEFDIDSKKIIFKNFPQGDSFVPGFEGNWNYDDLKQVLEALK